MEDRFSSIRRKLEDSAAASAAADQAAAVNGCPLEITCLICEQRAKIFGVSAVGTISLRAKGV